jgi:hypothetical protein
MTDTRPIEYVIHGITNGGKTFRPSDWSERLAGAMSCFGPASRGIRKEDHHLRYSLYVRPMIIENVKCVVLDSRLRKVEPYAFDFVLRFAKDNDLLLTSSRSEEVV